MEEFASEIVILIITAVIYALTVKRKKNRAKVKPGKRQERAQPSDFKAQMSQLARDLAADGDEPLDKLIRELRTPSGEGQDARPAEGAPAKPAPPERAEKTMFETTVASEARVRPEPTVKAPADLAAAVRALRAKAPKAAAPQPPKAPQPLGNAARRRKACTTRRAASAARWDRIARKANPAPSTPRTTVRAGRPLPPKAPPRAMPPPCAMPTSNSSAAPSSWRRSSTSPRRYAAAEARGVYGGTGCAASRLAQTNAA